MIIDLTNTKRYYKPFEIEKNDVKYVKINTEGRTIPGKNIQQKFADIVDDFLESNADNGLLIGVHCTHGLNRTGYLVCRYMIDRMKFDPKVAIEAFNEARGFNIERENYLTDLLNSNKDSEDKVALDETSDGEIIENEDSDNDESDDPVKADDDEPSTVAVADDKPELLTPRDNKTFGQRGGFRGKGFQNDFRSDGFQRRPFGAGGFQNNYNRGGFIPKFNNRRGYRSRNRGGTTGNYRGNFRGGWKEQPHFKAPYYDGDDEDLDDDTEVIITATERGTIIREERSISEHRRKLDDHGRGMGYRNTPTKARQQDDEDGTRMTKRGLIQNSDFYSEFKPRRKYLKESYHVGSWKGSGGFGEEGLSTSHRSFDPRDHNRGRGSLEVMGRGRGRGVQYQEGNEWSYGGRGYRDDMHLNKLRYDDGDSEDVFYSKKYSHDFGQNDRDQSSWPSASRYRGRGDREGFRGRGDGYRNQVEGRGGFVGRARGRDDGPRLAKREDSQLAFRPKVRQSGSYSTDQPVSPYVQDEMASGFPRFKDDSAMGFFGKKPRLAFHDDGGPPASNFRKNQAAGFREESPRFGLEDNAGYKRSDSYKEGFRKLKYRGRGRRESFGHENFREGDVGLPQGRRRPITLPAQYRDPEPLDNEDSPPFCDESPPFAGSDDELGSHEATFRNRERDEQFRSHGRGTPRETY